MKRLYFIIFLSFFLSQTAYSQLSNFVLNVTKTDESCTGNAALFFNATNTTPGSIMVYRIYKLPDVINTIAVVSVNTFGGLTSGTYRVVATQTLGASSGTQQQDITILDTRTNVTYEVTSAPINCDTGTINVNVLTGSPVSYEIISGPITVPPQPSNVFTNLTAGTYNIRVNDACGEGIVQTYTLTFSNPPNLTIQPPVTDCKLDSCNSISLSYLITASNPAAIRYPLVVEVTVFPPSGGTPIVQSQTIASGNAAALSVSNIIPFYYGQLYTYVIKVTDVCGNIYVRNGNRINLQLVAGAEQTYSNCIKGIRLGVCNFLPPYNVTFISAPAGFNPVTYNSTHPGPFTSEGTNYTSTPGNEIPNGTYVIQVTDACNKTVNCQVVVRDVEPLYSILIEPTTCDINTFLQIPADRDRGPFITTAVITSSTANLGSPIPYDVSSQISGGILIIQLPPGTYTVQGMDVCGHPYSYTVVMPPKAFIVNATPNNITGCSTNGLGGIRVTSAGSSLATVIITAAPAAFSQPLPYSATFLIPPTGTTSILIPNLPVGNYTLTVTDTCNNSYVKNVTIVANVSTSPLIFYDKKGCGENYDSIALESPNGALQTVIITAAPASFPFNLPYTVSFNIATNGIFYMNSFPQGSYTFYSKDVCNIERTSTYNLIGYHQVENIQILGNCGSFDLYMNFTDNTAGQAPDYWLQKFNPVTNQWVHPLTDAVFPPGSIPNATNSYRLFGSVMNYNIAAVGSFRILTRFSYYANGVNTSATCVQTIKTFDYTGQLKIVSAYAIPCVNGGSQVFIFADGTAPLHYSITTKNSLPFLIDNGTSNSFNNLQPGTYNFRVQDICGNIVNRLFDINTLQEPEITPNNLCAGSSGQLSVQPFSFLNYSWWKDNDPGTILSTTNTLNFNPYTTANAGLYHVRIYSTTLNSCVDRVLHYTISPNSLPNAGLDGSKVICGTSASINLFTILNGTYTSGGSWQEMTTSGMLVGSNWLPAGLPPGTYTFKYTVLGFCNATDDAIVTITLNPAVDTPVITAGPLFCPGEDIEFSVQSIPNAVYQWTGPNNFSSSLQNPTITNATAANTGTYTVKAIVGQCEAIAAVLINDKPTPGYTYEKYCDAGIFKVEIIPAQGSVFDPNTATYVWSGPNNFTSTSNPLVITNQPIGNYNVVVTNNQGCSLPQTVNVVNTFCDFPNVITPNNDGFNDSFDLTNYDVLRFQVFSRWGRLVYERGNYTNQWYGQNMHGGLLPDSTYYYFVQLKNGQEKHGWVFVGIRNN